MKIQTVQLNNPYQNGFNYNIYNRSSFGKNITSSSPDTFTRSATNYQQVNFTGSTLYEKLLTKYIKNKTYTTSIKGSKRPYIAIDENLKPYLTPLEIPVNKNEKINAWDININNPKRYIIFLHGFSQNITNNQPLYKAIGETDFGVLAIDYRGYGKSKPSRNITEDNIAEDIMAAIKYLNDKGIKDIGLVGHSFGSYAASKISNSTNNINFQILVSPMLSLEFWLKNIIKHPLKYKKEHKMLMYIPQYSQQFHNIFNIKKYTQKNTTPTYLIQSKNDRYIRTSKVTAFANDIPNLKSYTIIPTGGHRMDEAKISEITKILQEL